MRIIDECSPTPNPLSPDTEPVSPTNWQARVLIVDDNDDLAKSLARLIELHGHLVQIAQDGKAGVAKAQEWHPDCVFLDIGLPGMDGYEVASILRRDVQCRNIVIIALSGYDQEEDRERSRQAGFDIHLVKPIGASDLTEIIDQSRPARRTPPTP